MSVPKPSRQRSRHKDPEDFAHSLQRPSCMKEVFRLHAEGCYNSEIASAIKATWSGVAKFLRKHGLTSNRVRAEKKPIIRVNKDSWLCSKCNIVKSASEWSTTKGHPSGSQCKKCKAETGLARINGDATKNVRKRWVELKNRSKASGVTFMIPFEDFLTQWEAQNGKCFYTDTTILLDRGVGHRLDSFSVDKIEPKHGYVTGNVVICTSQANTIKNNMSLSQMMEWMPGWFDRIMVFWASRGHDFGPLA